MNPHISNSNSVLTLCGLSLASILNVLTFPFSV